MNPICILLLDVSQISDAALKTQTERLELAVNLMQAQTLDARLLAVSELLEDLIAEISFSQESNSLLSSLRFVFPFFSICFGLICA